MTAVRLSFVVAFFVTLVHAVVEGPGSPEALQLTGNLLLWEAATAAFGAILAGISMALLGRWNRTVAIALAPSLVVALEILAALVTFNAHHTLGPVLRTIVFFGAWAVPFALFLPVARRKPALKWATPLQGILLVGLVVVQFVGREPSPDPGNQPDLALVVLDAVQVRALGHMGAPMNPSPNIDSLAARGWTSDAAFSAAATSVPGHAAILWGLDVAEHRAPTNEFDLPGDLPESLADRLRDRGYTTMGFCHNPLISRASGFASGFDTWWNWGERSWMQAPARVALLHWPAVYLWLRKSNRDLVTLVARAGTEGARGPLFTFVQLLYTHDPYVDGDGWATPERIANIRTLIDEGQITDNTGLDRDEVARFHAKYLGAVAYSDRLIGEFLDRLRQRSGDRGLVVLLTADHGENLTERHEGAAGKHFGPWSTSLRIPLVVADSRVDTGGVRGKQLSSHQRAARLLLDAADQRLPLNPVGWTDRVSHDLALEPAWIYSTPWLIAVDDSLKISIDCTNLARPPEVHRWREDFEDRHDLAADSLAEVADRWEELLSLHAKMEAEGLFKRPESADPEKIEHLRALGYIE